MCGFVYGRF